MTSPRRRARAACCAVVLGLAVTLAGCSGQGLTAAERARATTLPTPTTGTPGSDARQALADRVRTLLYAASVSVDEDLVVDGTETESRLAWTDGGAVVDSSMLTIGTPGPGVEVFRSPSVLLSRTTGSGAACWSAAAPSLSRFDRPVAQEIAVLQSARAFTEHGPLIVGAVSARALLRIVGTDDELRRRALLPASGVQVTVTFDTSQRGLLMTTAWSSLVAAAGGSSRHTRVGTWMLRFEPVGTGGPSAPPARQVVTAARTDPSYASALAACNARIQ